MGLTTNSRGTPTASVTKGEEELVLYLRDNVLNYYELLLEYTTLRIITANAQLDAAARTPDQRGVSLLIMVGDNPPVSCETNKHRLQAHGCMAFHDGRSALRLRRHGPKGRVSRPFALLLLYKSSRITELDGFSHDWLLERGFTFERRRVGLPSGAVHHSYQVYGEGCPAQHSFGATGQNCVVKTVPQCAVCNLGVEH